MEEVKSIAASNKDDSNKCFNKIAKINDKIKETKKIVEDLDVSVKELKTVVVKKRPLAPNEQIMTFEEFVISNSLEIPFKLRLLNKL